MSDIEIVGLKRETTFTIELPERAVRALALIGDFGERALEKAVATVLSETEAKRHAGGLADLQRIGGVAHAVLNRLADARHVANGDKVALWKKDVESASQQQPPLIHVGQDGEAHQGPRAECSICQQQAGKE